MSSFKNVELATALYHKGDPQHHPDVAYLFTDNAEAYMYSHGIDGWQNMGPNPRAPKINVSDCRGHNQAGIRTGYDGSVSPNAYGIVVKKYQQDADGSFVAKEGCFKETQEDFELFKELNTRSFLSIAEPKVIMPTQMGLSKSAMPRPFVEWMQAELARRFGAVSHIEENKNIHYEGYGLRVTEINREKAMEIADAYVESPIRPQKEDYSLSFTESQGGYKDRTYENANAPEVDFTFAFAKDFFTAGERCTTEAAGNSIVQIELPDEVTHESIKETVLYIGLCLPREASDGREIGINLAGNGIHTLMKYGFSQEKCDLFCAAVMKDLKDRGLNITSIRSGGQSGVDESAMAVGYVLGIPTTIHAPNGYRFRTVDNEDRRGFDEFVKRYQSKDLDKIKESVERLLSPEQKKEKKNNYQIKR